MSALACAIDVGTNTLLGLIATRDHGSIRAIDDLGHVTRLGAGLEAAGRLSPEGIDRAIGALASIVARARALGADRIAAVGTSAVRDASNRGELVARARTELGVEIEVIDGTREAALTFAGARARDPSCEHTVIDVGGGSTEIARGRARRLERSWSLDIGSVRLFERHLASDPPAPAERAALLEDVDHALDRSGAEPGPTLIALAGTACTIAAVARSVAFDARICHGTVLAQAELRQVADRLASMPIAARRALPAVPAGREDVIAAGALLLARIAERANARTIEISDGGVRWGLALELLAHGAEGC